MKRWAIRVLLFFSFMTAVAQNSNTVGTVGPRGYTGARGPAASITVHSTATGDPGTSAIVNNSGNTSQASLDITIPRGSVMYSGSGAPSNGTGGNQDFYVRTDTGCLYGPKASGVWPGSCTSLVGPPPNLTIGTVHQGAAGATITGVTPNQILNLTLPTSFSAQYGNSIIGDSTWFPDGSHGATTAANSVGFKVAQALNMPLSSDYAIPGSNSADCFPLMITPNALNPGPGFGTIPSTSGWNIISLGINDVGRSGTPSQAQAFYFNNLTACAEWMAVARQYKVMATDPSPYAVLAGGFASSSTLINGGAISTTNGATATFTIQSYGNKLHLLYAAYQQGALVSATYVSGGSVTGVAGQGCFVQSFNNSSTASATIKLTGTNTIAGGADIPFIVSGNGTGATAAPTTAVLSSGSATCSGTITITSVLGAGGAAGSTVGQASVVIDGTPPVASPTLNAQPPSGVPMASLLNSTAAITDVTYPVGAGTHTVVVTTQNTGAFLIGGVLSQGPYTVNAPEVGLTGVPHQNLCANDANTAIYDSLAQQVANGLAADSIPVTFIDARTAIGCNVSDGTLGNAGMSGNPTTLPDGTVGAGSTSPGAHMNNVGMELYAHAVINALAPAAIAVQSKAVYSTAQDPTPQYIQTSVTNQAYHAVRSYSSVNSGAWPVNIDFGHTAFGAGPGVTPSGYYFDVNNNIWHFFYVNNEALASMGQESALFPLIGLQNGSAGSHLETILKVAGGAASTMIFPSIDNNQLIYTMHDTHPAYAASLAFNTSYSLSTTALTGNVTTMTLNAPYNTLGGQFTTIGFCNPGSGGPYTVAAPSTFDVTHAGYTWPFASTSNFDTTFNMCNIMDIFYDSGQSVWKQKPYAHLHFANTFTMPQTMPSLVLGSDSSISNGPRAFLKASTGPIAAIIANGQYNPAKLAKAGTVENIIGSSSTFTCSVNPTMTLEDCGTTAGTCSSPSAIGSVTLTAANTTVDGTVSSPTLTAGHYFTWETTAGTCTVLNFDASAEYKMN